VHESCVGFGGVFILCLNNLLQANKYLENYERALSGFEAAALKDPGLNATGEVQKIVNLLDKVDNLLRVMKFSLVMCNDLCQ
jgi:hypothetical protein